MLTLLPKGVQKIVKTFLIEDFFHLPPPAIERWANTKARLAGWRRLRRVTRPGEICDVMDGPFHLPWRTVPLPLALHALELLSCELLGKSSCCCWCSSIECTQNTVMSFITQGRHWSKLYLDLWRLSVPYTDKKENKISSCIRKFRVEQLQKHIWGRAS